jgi:hypothetical protein
MEKREIFGVLQDTGHFVDQRALSLYDNGHTEPYSPQRVLDYLTYSLSHSNNPDDFKTDGVVIKSRYDVPEDYYQTISQNKQNFSPSLEKLLKEINPISERIDLFELLTKKPEKCIEIPEDFPVEILEKIIGLDINLKELQTLNQNFRYLKEFNGMNFGGKIDKKPYWLKMENEQTGAKYPKLSDLLPKTGEKYPMTENGVIEVTSFRPSKFFSLKSTSKSPFFLEIDVTYKNINL